MKKRRRILTVAGILVAIAVVDFIVLNYAGVGDGEPMLVRTWRLFLTCLLSFFLALGKNSARWLVVILTGLGSLGCFVAASLLLASGGVHDEGGPIIFTWLVIIMISYGIISAYLAYSTGVSREIRRIAEYIEGAE